LIGAFAVILVFMFVEIVGGLISGSLALLADATHMFADAAALGLAASAHVIARRPPDSERHFGYQRMQVLAAFFNGATLIVLCLWIVIEAAQRFFGPKPVNADLMLGVAAAGFVANAIAFAMLQSPNSKNVNVRGAMLHVLADLLSSLAAIAAAVLIKYAKLIWFDPLLSLLVAGLILSSAIRLLRETGHILLEGAPRGINVDKLVEGVKASAPGVQDVHDIRIWQITPESTSLTLHARIGDAAGAEVALGKIKGYLEKEFGIRQSTVQIEVGDDCPDCETASDRAPAAETETAPVRHAAAECRAHGHAHAHAHGSPQIALQK
jgi:cobalt-zinc-cadmium efflux system protein